MLFDKCVESVSTFSDLKREAAEYVIDYRQLSFDELKTAMKKTAPQFYNFENIKKTLGETMLHQDRDTRILSSIILNNVLLDSDDFTSLSSATDNMVLDYEQDIVDESNEFDGYKDIPGGETYKFVLETAWEHNNDVSVDEQNLLNKLRTRLGISERMNNITEASIGKYPKAENAFHTKDEIGKVRRYLQSRGLIFTVRDSSGDDYDVIPEEIAKVIRELNHVDIKKYGYDQLLQSKYVKSKSYLTKMLEKADVEVAKSISLTELQNLTKEKLTAHELIGGFSPRDGLELSTLNSWCASLELQVSGAKAALVDRIVEYYDNLRQIILNDEADDRELYYKFYNEIASRQYTLLREQKVIAKDLDCEHQFEQATNYLFEKKMNVKPLMMAGTEHPDGMLSFNDKLILWDNKSKETDVNLSDHLKQFDRYISNSDKRVSVFMVIGPSFTENSAAECAKYSMTHETLILLITSTELKNLAEDWYKAHPNEAFPLGYFKQSGRFNRELLSI